LKTKNITAGGLTRYRKMMEFVNGVGMTSHKWKIKNV